MRIKRTNEWSRGIAKALVVMMVIFSICCTSAAAMAEPEYVDLDKAMEQFQGAMARRESEFTIYVTSTENLAADRAVSRLLSNPAMDGDTPGSFSASGDYLKKIWEEYSYTVVSSSSDTWKIIFHDIKYRTDAEQEERLSKEIDLVLEHLDLEGKSDYVKCRKIYEYICSHVEYDYESYEVHKKGDYVTHNLSYTAYAALIDGKAVCSGYAHLFYAMCHSAGVPVRIVRGTAQGKDGWTSHAWNIVKLGNEWYQLDCTWDRGDEPSDWRYFLKGTRAFQKHKLADEFLESEFMRAFPLSSSTYIPTREDCKCLLLYEQAFTVVLRNIGGLTAIPLLSSAI